MFARFPQPSAVETAMPTTSPTAQPVRQCVVAEKAARPRSGSACACKAVHRLEQLTALRAGRLLVSRGKRFRNAMIHVVVEHLEGEIFESRVDGGNLGEDVDAVAIVLDHPLDPAHLPLDPVEPLDQ